MFPTSRFAKARDPPWIAAFSISYSKQHTVNPESKKIKDLRCKCHSGPDPEYI